MIEGWRFLKQSCLDNVTRNLERYIAGMDKIAYQRVIQAALDARKKAYAPYSHYSVGAALVTKEGKLFTGCNIENASYGASNCAERTAFFKAISEGEQEFTAIAIAGGAEETIQEYAYPCGICRQVMQEFCQPNFKILVVKDLDQVMEYTLQQLLPFGFGGESIV